MHSSHNMCTLKVGETASSDYDSFSFLSNIVTLFSFLICLYHCFHEDGSLRNISMRLVKGSNKAHVGYSPVSPYGTYHLWNSLSISFFVTIPSACCSTLLSQSTNSSFHSFNCSLLTVVIHVLGVSCEMIPHRVSHYVDHNVMPFLWHGKLLPLAISFSMNLSYRSQRIVFAVSFADLLLFFYSSFIFLHGYAWNLCLAWLHQRSTWIVPSSLELNKQRTTEAPS